MPQGDSDWISSQHKPTTWKCGDPYKYPIPKPAGDPWNVLLEPHLKEDRVKCDAWKDEVQTLLIFAGLFSAVVTAFVVQSYQSLQEDPNLALLDQIAVSLQAIHAALPNSSLSVNALGDSSASLGSSASSTRINIVWFLSLMLSLTTVLFGIVALQWIREHQRYAQSVNSKEALAMFRMRTEGLEAWYVPQIFDGLPLLLQSSLVLFFVGIVDFLFSLNKTVAIPVTVVVALTLLFLVATTVLPTFQLFFLTVTIESTSNIPTECPYKSPQSWAFLKLSKWIYANGYAVYSFVRSRPSEWAVSQVPLQIFFDLEARNWIFFDYHWLDIRDASFQFIEGFFTSSFESTHPRRPKYDETMMLIEVMKNYPAEADLANAAYHCFNEISSTILYRDYDGDDESRPPQFRVRNELLQQYFKSKKSGAADVPVSMMLKEPDSALLHEENMASFILLSGSHLYSGIESAKFRTHLFELQTRMLGHLYANRPHRPSDIPVQSKHVWVSRICEQYKHFGFQSGFPDISSSIAHDIVQDLVEQYFEIFSVFARTAVNIDDEHMMKTTYGQEKTLLEFLKVPPYLLSQTSSLVDSTRVLAMFQSSLDLISSSLDKSIESDAKSSSDFLFLCSCIIAKDLFSLEPNWNTEMTNSIISLVKVLLKYELQLDKRSFLRRLEPLVPWAIHSFFDPERHSYVFVSTTRMPVWIRRELFYLAPQNQESKVVPRTQRREPPSDTDPVSTAASDQIIDSMEGTA